MVFSLEIGGFYSTHSFFSDIDFCTVKGLKIAYLNVKVSLSISMRYVFY